jgi:AcrR family transcriptional regulator
MDVFWDRGFAAASLDDLGHAMGMNRPSIYAAFGDKESLYLQALEQYRAGVRAAFVDAFGPDRPLRRALRDFYTRAIKLYLSGSSSARGCLVIGTALAEAVTNPTVRASLADGLHRLDRAFAARIAVAQAKGEVDPNAKPGDLGKIASAMLYLLAIEARAGQPRKVLTATVNAAINAICA